MKRFFYLYDHCKYASGRQGGCIYNTITGQMISVDKELDDLIRHSFANQEIDDEDSLLQEVEKMELGTFTEFPVSHENFLDLDHKMIKYQLVNSMNYVENLFLQISNQCDQDCEFCDDSNYVFTKTHCKKWNNDVLLCDYDKLFEEFSYLGGKKLYIIGGAPFSEFNRFEELIKKANRFRFERVSVYTNIKDIGEEHLLFCKNNNIGLIAEIMEWTQGERDALLDIPEKGIEVEVSILVWEKTEKQIESILYWLNEHGFKKVRADILYDSVYGIANCTLAEKRFGAVTSNLLEFNDFFNSCLYGKVYVRTDGKVTPCPMMNEIILGDINSESLAQILEKKEYQEIIHLTREKIIKCGDCAFRFNCEDCRALEMSASGNVLEMAYCKR